MKRCTRCIQNFTGDSCPNCKGPFAPVKESLVANAVLSSRYNIGAALAQSRQGICYAALDSVTETPVLVEEFYPRSAVRRDGLRVMPKEGFSKSFQTALNAEPTGRTLNCQEVIKANGTVYRVYQPKAGESLDKQAAALLDSPVLFRNSAGEPTMSINLLPIPSLPKARKAQGSHHVQAKRAHRTLLVLLLLVVLVVGGGAAAMMLGSQGQAGLPGEANTPVAAVTQNVPTETVTETPESTRTAAVTAAFTYTAVPTQTPEATQGYESISLVIMFQRDGKTIKRETKTVDYAGQTSYEIADADIPMGYDVSRLEDRIIQIDWEQNPQLTRVECEFSRMMVTVVYEGTTVSEQVELEYNPDGMTIPVQAPFGYDADATSYPVMWEDLIANPSINVACTPWTGDVCIRYVNASGDCLKKDVVAVNYAEYPATYRIEANLPAFCVMEPEAATSIDLVWENGELNGAAADVLCRPWQADVTVQFRDEADQQLAEHSENLVFHEDGNVLNLVEWLTQNEELNKEYRLADSAQNEITVHVVADGQLDVEPDAEGKYVIVARLEEKPKEDQVKLRIAIDGVDTGYTVPVTVAWMDDEMNAAEYLADNVQLKGLCVSQDQTFHWDENGEIENADDFLLNCVLDTPYAEWQQDERGVMVYLAQQKLQELGYAQEWESGLYDEATAKALKLFCLVNDLAAETNGNVSSEKNFGAACLTVEMQEKLFADGNVQIKGIMELTQVKLGQPLPELKDISSKAVVKALAGDGKDRFAPRYIAERNSAGDSPHIYSRNEEYRNTWILAATEEEYKANKATVDGVNFLRAYPWTEVWVLITDGDDHYIVYLEHYTDEIDGVSCPICPSDESTDLAILSKVTKNLYKVVSRDKKDDVRDDDKWTVEEAKLLAEWLFEKIPGAPKCDVLYPEWMEALVGAEENEGCSHSKYTYRTLKEATCGEAGLKVQVCTVCNQKIETESIPATGKHSYDAGEVTKEASCTDIGTITYTCNVCAHQRKEGIPAEHDWDEGVEQTAATCEKDGEMLFTCKRSDCEQTQTVPITMLGHDLEDVDEVAASCTVDGHTAGKKCMRCEYYTYTIITAGHDWASTITTEPTCQKKGVCTYTCNRSGCTASYTEDIDSGPQYHKFEKKSGPFGKYRKCSVCEVQLPGWD